MTEARAPKGPSRWAALALWGAVIAAGALYLASVEKHRRAALSEDRVATAVAPAVSAPAAPAAPAVPVALPASAVAPPPVAVAPPVLTPAAAPEAAVTTPAAAPVTPAEARAFAEAVTEVRPPPPTAVPLATGQATDQPTGQTLGPGAMTSVPARAPAPQSAMPAAAAIPGAAERARILAEYQALHRAAPQDSARSWGGRMPPRGYGVPAYAPGIDRSRQPPGYYPGYPGR